MRTEKLSSLSCLPVSRLEFNVVMPKFSDEEYVAQKTLDNQNSTVNEMLTHFLSRVVTRIGDDYFKVDEKGRPLLSEAPAIFSRLIDLPVPDVETLYAYVQYKMDPIYAYELGCDCDTPPTLEFDIGDLEVEVLEEDESGSVDVSLYHGIPFRDELFKNLSLGHTKWKSVYKSKDMIEARRGAYREMIKLVDGKPRIITESMLSDISVGDRKRMAKAALTLKGGTNYSFKAVCTCGKQHDWSYDPLENTSFF